MSDVLSQPKGAGTTVKNGTISIGAPLAVGTGAYNSNYTIDTLDKRSIIKSWDNDIFKKTYINKGISVYANLNSNTYVKNKRLMTRLMEKEFLPHELVYMSPQDNFPENWKELIDEREKTDKLLYELPFLPCAHLLSYQSSLAS